MNNLFDIEDEMDDFEKNLNKYLDNNTISKAFTIKNINYVSNGIIKYNIKFKNIIKIFKKR